MPFPADVNPGGESTDLNACFPPVILIFSKPLKAGNSMDGGVSVKIGRPCNVMN